MSGIELSLNRRKLILKTLTKMIDRSFRNLSKTEKRRFVGCSGVGTGLEIRRKLWHVKNPDSTSYSRVVARFDIEGKNLNGARIFAKAGLTSRLGLDKGHGLTAGYGWNEDFRSPEFERNMVRQMSKATKGVKLYCSTPGEKAAVAKITRPIELKKYLNDV